MNDSTIDPLDEFLDDWVDAYLRNTLPPEERTEFERQLKEDPSLQAKLAFAQRVQRAVSNHRRADLLRAMKTGRRGIDRAQFRRQIRETILYAVAALLVIAIILVAYMILSKDPAPSPPPTATSAQLSFFPLDSSALPPETLLRANSGL